MRVHVPLHEVTAQPAVRAERPLEVERERLAPAIRASSRAPSPDRSSAWTSAPVREDHRQAHAVDAPGCRPADSSGASGDAIRSRKPPLVGLRSTSSPDGFNEAREHILQSAASGPSGSTRRSIRSDAMKRTGPAETRRRPPEAMRRDVIAGRSRRRPRPMPPRACAAPPSSSSDSDLASGQRVRAPRGTCRPLQPPPRRPRASSGCAARGLPRPRPPTSR